MTIRDLQFGSLVAAFFLLLRIQCVSTSGNFELQILEISNTNSHLLSGYCCGTPLSIRSTKTTGCPQCATAFRLCLKEYQQSTVQTQPGVLNGCSFGNVTSGVIGGSSFVLSDLVAKSGSLVLPFTFRWTKSFTLILQALDMYNSSYPVSEQLIDEASFSGVILPSSEWNTLNYIGKNARITYRVRVQCSENYFNTTCTTFCRPRNDQFGHFTCGERGNKVCLSGWKGANCEEAICKRGCHEVHGSCSAPGECVCRSGWEGPLCDQCKVYPGCRHGYCNGSAWQCICDTNWGGILCDQDLNYCGTHEPCLHGGTCENIAPDRYRCTCTEGLSGDRCEIVEHPCATQPCRNGGTCTLKNPTKYDGSGRKEGDKTLEQTTAVVVRRGMRGMSSMGKPVSVRPTSESNSVLLSNNAKMSSILSPTPPVNEFTCTCATGWTGSTCEINIDECSGDPCEHSGTCIDLVGGFRCECPPEWTGDVCDVDVNECESNTSSALGPCINAESCTNTPGAFTCTCLEGWSGLTCAKDIDDCVGQCKNGATCIDLVNDYHCACANGFTGRDCETDIDECAVNPCANGGECVNMIAKFKCICPVGYSGTLCEEAEDHCSPTPCVEGSCLNTPGGYYCHCPAGRAGRHCELLATPCKSPPCYVGCTAPNSNSSIPCNGHGKCETKENGQSCLCYYGFTGPYCEHNLNDCLPNPCINGMCLDGDGKFTCKCAPGWSGKTCTERITQCFSGQCANGGSCAPTIIGGEATSVCICANGWGGAFCTEPIDQCQGQPCHNGGTCESGTGWFRCACAQGFSGPDCRINVNECSPQPCLGGATCIDGIGGFTCICPKGRRGLRCEILLSDPSSVCLNTTSLSPYNAIGAETSEDKLDETNCNSCICVNGKPKCSNLWCGLKNCLRSNVSSGCDAHEVCVPLTLQESCLSPPCIPRGDCRSLEPSRRVAPPKLPAPVECWPNQAVLDENCARITILLQNRIILPGTSVEGICLSLRTLLGTRLVKVQTDMQSPLLVLLCDLKTGTNDTIEVTISSTTKNPEYISQAVSILGELLSRGSSLGTTYSAEEIEAAPLAAILEVKVETALVTNEQSRSGFLLMIVCATAIAALVLGAFGALFWRRRVFDANGSGVNLSPNIEIARHDEEKSNNIQNEENFRRLANPLKGSATSLSGGMELSMHPTPDVVSVISLGEGSSATSKSQTIYPCDGDFDAIEPKLKSNRGSQILYKVQNIDMRKNTVGSLESPHKDFGKRSINKNCKTLTPVLDSECLTVHV